MCRYDIGDIIHDCYLCGIGGYDNICKEGVVEAVGNDWVIVRVENGNVVFTNRSPEELYEFINN